MKIGSLVYATDQGLGVLAKSFYDAGVVTDVMVVRHQHHRNHDEWYPRAQQTPIRPMDTRRVQAFCASVDVMLFLETPFNWSLLPYCSDVKTKTVIMPMHECMPERLPYQPDAFLCPSLLDLDCYPSGKFIPVPVAVPWRKRERARIFVHNAGWGGLKSRNGTGELLDAMKHVKSPIKLILRTQKPLQWHVTDPRIEVRVGTFDDIWSEGDVFVFPEKFNGLSLPLQEARASGMLVMCGDRHPMNTWLPNRYHDVPGGCFNDESLREMRTLIPVAGYRKQRIGPPYREFDEAIFDPIAVAAKIDEWYDRDISEYSESGRVWAEQMSWAALKPRYEEFFRCLI